MYQANLVFKYILLHVELGQHDSFREQVTHTSRLLVDGEK
jgi:hypothetical protein